MNKSRYISLVFILFFVFLFFGVKNINAQSNQAQLLDVSIVGNGLLINSCGSQLPFITGYKGYINNIEFMSTGDFGGFPCYGGGMFIPSLNSFYSINASTTSFESRFDFYANTDFNSGIIKTFTIYYNNQNFSLSSSTQSVCEINCNSSVMFFPGVMGSRLYDSNGELWVSRDSSLQSILTLDQNGKSINSVFTKDDTQNINDEAETGIVDEVFGTNIYNSFINNLRDWKNDGTVSDYAFVPYDWRLSLEDIVNSGATTTSGYLFYNNNQDFSESYILKKLVEMQKNSKSGKVTLIGHSNGGLVIKALVQKLKDTNNPLYEKIDKIIFVAVPQVGTPDAVVSLLHGSSLGPLGFVMSNATLRSLAENMPTVYNLLPTDGYFSTIDPSIAADKVVTFQDDPAFATQISQYGVYVSNTTELKNYILGTDGRSKPIYSDTNSPNIGNTLLYNNSESTHVSLDNWQAPQETKVIQVAGWGEETTSGISYKRCYDNSVQGHYKCMKLIKVIDGDGVVVTPSALWMSTTTPNIERWWVNLFEYDTFTNTEREHRDILEVKNLNDFIDSKLKNVFWNDSENIVVNNTSSLVPDGAYLHYTLHSPLSLGVYDNLGRYTGLDLVTGNVKNEIPGVKYEVAGDTQFISIPGNLFGRVELKGISDGVFTLDVEKQIGNNIVESTSIGGVPSLAETVVVLDVNPNIASTTLNIDKNGDGVFEKQINTNGKGEVIYDNLAPEVMISYSTTTRSIVWNGRDENFLGVTVATSTVKVKDTQDNVTELYFSKLKNDKNESKVVLKKISRNGQEASLSNAEIKFEIDIKKNGIISEFKSKVEVGGKEVFILKYDAEKGITKIVEKTTIGYINTVRQGLVIEKIVTKDNGLVFEY